MENTTPAPTVTESAPTSTAEVAANVIDAFEQTETSDSGIEVSGDAPEPTAQTHRAAEDEGKPVTSDGSPQPEAKPEPSPEDAEIEALLAEYGFKDVRKPDGREHYIPRSKVLKMIGSGLKRGQEKWTTERSLIEQQANEYRGYVEALRQGVQGDETAFLRELASIDPRYARFLEPQAQPQAQAPAVDDRPQPDVDLGNGQWTYSREQNEKLIEWKARQLLDARLKPIEEQTKAEKERLEREQFERGVRERAQTLMAEAQTWPLFGQLPADGKSYTPFQTEVLTELQKDSERARAEGRRPQMSLRQAYLEVYARHQQPDKIRERLLSEMKQAPRSTAVARGSTDLPKPTGPVSTQDIAARTLARLERGA